MRDRKKHRRALELIRSLRVEHLDGPPPYTVRLIGLLGREPTPEEDEEVDKLANAIDEWLRKGSAHLADWGTVLKDDIAPGAYRATDEVYLDQYTYRGDNIVGVKPDWEN